MVAELLAYAAITRVPEFVWLIWTSGRIGAATTVLAHRHAHTSPKTRLPQVQRARLAKGPRATAVEKAYGLVHPIIAYSVSQTATFASGFLARRLTFFCTRPALARGGGLEAIVAHPPACGSNGVGAARFTFSRSAVASVRLATAPVGDIVVALHIPRKRKAEIVAYRLSHVRKHQRPQQLEHEACKGRARAVR